MEKIKYESIFFSKRLKNVPIPNHRKENGPQVTNAQRKSEVEKKHDKRDGKKKR